MEILDRLLRDLHDACSAFPDKRKGEGSLLTDWRRQRDAGAREALKAVKRGPKVAEPNPLTAGHAQLPRDYKRLTLRLQRAEAIIEIQKKVALLLGLSMPGDEAS